MNACIISHRTRYCKKSPKLVMIPSLPSPKPRCLSTLSSSSSMFLGGQKHREPQPPGSLLLSWSTSGLYIRPLINPQWKPSYDILTGQAPVLDRSWFIATESQPTLIYFSFGKEGKHWTEKPCWMHNTWCKERTSRFLCSRWQTV